MLTPTEAKQVKFETTGEEIMKVGADTLGDLFIIHPQYMLIHNELSKAIAITVAKLVHEKIKN